MKARQKQMLTAIDGCTITYTVLLKLSLLLQLIHYMYVTTTVETKGRIALSKHSEMEDIHGKITMPLSDWPFLPPC